MRQKRRKKERNKWIDKLAAMLGQIDAADVQKHLVNVQQAIAAIQSILSEFQGVGQEQRNKEAHPFSFRKD
ncbi:hypothetical protein LR69_00424 [Geobacillus sp. BCO2]|nr:hypothetical protein LR69_00424 [Geobacillus sp. BCO2]